MNNKPKVAFICVHNSCRSQVAEALGKHFASDVFESFSAGTETKPQINQDAVRLMKRNYNINVEETQYSKLITELPEIDIKVTMGCNVICPFVDSSYEEDWGLDDPTGKSDEEFELVIAEIEKKVKELAERLNSQESLRKRMTTDIAHELRTPLAAIQSHIEAFLDGVWEPNDEKLSVIHGEIIRLTKLINELSELSIVEDDEINLKLSNVDISSTLNNIIESYEPMFLDKNINIDKNIQNDVNFMGDIDYLKRIFVNIISNAIKYTNENGSVSVSLEQIKDKIKIIVKDTGIGIPKEDLKYIFERFYRSDLSRNRHTGGTGIGLTITKALVEAHGGTIKIDSEVGKGTNVIVEFNR